LPLRIGAANTKFYIERGADWCGQGKNNSFFEGCGTSTCPYGSFFLYLHIKADTRTQYTHSAPTLSSATMTLDTREVSSTTVNAMHSTVKPHSLVAMVCTWPVRVCARVCVCVCVCVCELMQETCTVQ